MDESKDVYVDESGVDETSNSVKHQGSVVAVDVTAKDVDSGQNVEEEEEEKQDDMVELKAGNETVTNTVTEVKHPEVGQANVIVVEESGVDKNHPKENKSKISVVIASTKDRAIVLYNSTSSWLKSKITSLKQQPQQTSENQNQSNNEKSTFLARINSLEKSRKIKLGAGIGLFIIILIIIIAATAPRPSPQFLKANDKPVFTIYPNSGDVRLMSYKKELNTIHFYSQKDAFGFPSYVYSSLSLPNQIDDDDKFLSSIIVNSYEQDTIRSQSYLKSASLNTTYMVFEWNSTSKFTINFFTRNQQLAFSSREYQANSPNIWFSYNISQDIALSDDIEPSLSTKGISVILKDGNNPVENANLLFALMGEYAQSISMESIIIPGINYLDGKFAIPLPSETSIEFSKENDLLAYRQLVAAQMIGLVDHMHIIYDLVHDTLCKDAKDTLLDSIDSLSDKNNTEDIVSVTIHDCEKIVESWGEQSKMASAPRGRRSLEFSDLFGFLTESKLDTSLIKQASKPGISSIIGLLPGSGNSGVGNVIKNIPFSPEMTYEEDADTLSQESQFTQCNGINVAGGNEAVTKSVNLGSFSKKFTFYYESFSVPDQFVVSQQGQVLLDSGCVGTEGYVEKKVNLVQGSKTTSIQIQVTPNCANTDSTAWEFVVVCTTDKKIDCKNYFDTTCECSDGFSNSPTKQKPVPITTNGCGAAQGISKAAANALLGGEPWNSGFQSVCNKHDKCYGTAGAIRSGCDDEMKTGLLAVCQMMDASVQDKCDRHAKSMSNIVKIGGRGAFKDAQNEFCYC